MEGRTISHYKILDKIGEGGMGVVYKAEDTKLHRTIALKFLRPDAIQTHELKARFLNEAEAAAALIHPNICVVHEIDEADGESFIAMEYVEGESLAERIKRRPLPLDEALDIAAQVAEGLRAAHERSIDHRDVKPANVMLDTKGRAKIMDFGLAHLEDATRITKTGTFIGTPAYMSPEQVRGEKTDQRTDIWAFGAVLHEMITGQPPFGGETEQALSYTILHVEPEPLTALRSGVPVDLDRIVVKLLAKDPDERYQHIDEALVDLRALRKRLPETTKTRTAAEPTPVAAARQARLPWAVAAIAVLIALAFAFFYFRQAPPELQAIQFSLEPPPGAVFTNQDGGCAASPDGRYVVFAASGEGESRQSLWLRPLASETARKLAGTEGGEFPTWSPDSRSLVFHADNQLKRIEITGGTTLTLSEATNSYVTPTGTWNRDGVILFGSAAGLQRVSASGGGATLLTEADPAQQETGHGYPQFLPGDDRFLYFVASDDPNVQGVYASSLGDPGQRSLIVRAASKAVYVPPRAAYPGYLLWLQDQTLVARRFDPDALEFEGDPVSVAERIGRGIWEPVRAEFWASEAGLLTYFGGNAWTPKRIVWMSRDGIELGEVAPEDAYRHLALAPDGERMAVSITEASGASGYSNTDIWVRELATGRMTRLTIDPTMDDNPTWSPDGKQIAFAFNPEHGVNQIYRKDASGVGDAERLTEGRYEQAVCDWSHDGRFLGYCDNNPGTGWDAMVLPLEGDRTPIPVAQTQFSEEFPNISPDGQWVSYCADYTGRSEVYVQAFPGADGAPQGRRVISNNGGRAARWRDDGKELYYQSLDGDLMAVRIEASPQGIRADTPRELLTGLELRGWGTQFDFTPDGERFLLILPSAEQQERQQLTVVSNFQATLGE